METTSLTQLKSWFSKEKKPTQAQFWALLDSFFHRGEKIHADNIEGLPTSLPASDVPAWAKAASKPTYNASEVGALPNGATITINNEKKYLKDNPSFTIAGTGSNVVVHTIGNIHRMIPGTSPVQYEILEHGDYESADDVRITGFYKTLDNPRGVPYNVRGNFMLHFDYDDFSASQEYHSRKDDNLSDREAEQKPVVYYRRKTHGLWGDWYTFAMTKWVKPN